MSAINYRRELHEANHEAAPDTALPIPHGLTEGALMVWLTQELGLEAIGKHVVGANVYGYGPNAIVDIRLGDGRALRCDRFGDLTKPGTLSTWLVTVTGVYRSFKGPQAGAIASGVHKLAKHHAEATASDSAREWAAEFLRIAPTMDVAMDDQMDRWRAFSVLAQMNPASDAGEDRSAQAIAQACLVLVDKASGRRYVRASWFQAYVKREPGGTFAPSQLTAQMESVGWRWPNSQGRVKATNPAEGRQLSWAFFVVDAVNPDPPVTAGYVPYARAHTRARTAHREPAVTRNPDNGAEPPPEERCDKCGSETYVDSDGDVRCRNGHSMGEVIA